MCNHLYLYIEVIAFEQTDKLPKFIKKKGNKQRIVKGGLDRNHCQQKRTNHNNKRDPFTEPLSKTVPLTG